MDTALVLLGRVRRLWWLKAGGTALFMWSFFLLYFRIQGSPHYSVTDMPLTWLDRAIPMQAWAWIPYLSLWVYTTLPAAFQPNFRYLAYYGVCIAAVCAAGLLCFYFWPTSTSTLYKPPEAGLSLLKGIDLAGNACPSLHVATAAFSWAWLRYQLRQIGAGAAWQAANVAWVVVIVFSTLATKQHVAWDVAGGTLLGGFSAFASLQALRWWPLSALLRSGREATQRPTKRS
jgi:hypothetical protein